MDFDLTATTECDFCGNYLSSSDEECGEHIEGDIGVHFFRELNSDNLSAVRATREHCWQKLANNKGEGWIRWMYLGERELVSNFVKDHEISEIPHKQMAHQVTSVDLKDE